MLLNDTGAGIVDTAAGMLDSGSTAVGLAATEVLMVLEGAKFALEATTSGDDVTARAVVVGAMAMSEETVLVMAMGAEVAIDVAAVEVVLENGPVELLLLLLPVGWAVLAAPEYRVGPGMM